MFKNVTKFNYTNIHLLCTLNYQNDRSKIKVEHLSDFNK